MEKKEYLKPVIEEEEIIIEDICFTSSNGEDDGVFDYGNVEDFDL